MRPTTFQQPEIRDENNNIIIEGAYGKNTAFCNNQNTGIMDYINNNLLAINASIKDYQSTLDGVTEPYVAECFGLDVSDMYVAADTASIDCGNA